MFVVVFRSLTNLIVLFVSYFVPLTVEREKKCPVIVKEGCKMCFLASQLTLADDDVFNSDALQG